MGGRGLPKEQVARIQHERLIDAFVQLVADEGYERAGVRATCKRAGVAYNTFYEHFSSTEEVFVQSFDIGVTVLAEEMQARALLPSDPWNAQVRAAITSFIDLLTENPAFARLLMVEAHKVGPTAIVRLSEYFESLFAVLQAAKPAANSKVKSAELLPLVLGGIYTRVYVFIRAGRMEDLPPLIPTLTSFVLMAFPERRARAPRRHGRGTATG